MIWIKTCKNVYKKKNGNGWNTKKLSVFYRLPKNIYNES